MKKRIALPSQTLLREYFDYDGQNLVWRKRVSPRVRLGTAAGNVKTDHHTGRTFRELKVDGRTYKGSRLVWMWHTGEDPGELDVDHIDDDPLNDSIHNLRLLTRQENLARRESGVGVNGYHRWSS